MSGELPSLSLSLSDKKLKQVLRVRQTLVIKVVLNEIMFVMLSSSINYQKKLLSD